MVANIGPTQNVVAAAFQSGIGNSNERVGTAEQTPRTNEVQPREAPTAEMQKSGDRSLERREEAELRSSNTVDSRNQEDTPRGSLLDIQA